MWSFKWLTYTKYSKIAASKIITSYVILLKIWINHTFFLKLSSSKLNIDTKVIDFIILIILILLLIAGLLSYVADITLGAFAAKQEAGLTHS